MSESMLQDMHKAACSHWYNSVSMIHIFSWAQAISQGTVNAVIIDIHSPSCLFVCVKTFACHKERLHITLKPQPGA